MNCPICENKAKVINTTRRKRWTSRRHECRECLTRFRTVEKIDLKSIPKYLQGRIKDESFSS